MFHSTSIELCFMFIIWHFKWVVFLFCYWVIIVTSSFWVFTFTFTFNVTFNPLLLLLSSSISVPFPLSQSISSLFHFIFDNLLQQVQFHLPLLIFVVVLRSLPPSAFFVSFSKLARSSFPLTKVSHLCAFCAVGRTVTACEAVALFIVFCTQKHQWIVLFCALTQGTYEMWAQAPGASTAHAILSTLTVCLFVSQKVLSWNQALISYFGPYLYCCHDLFLWPSCCIPPVPFDVSTVPQKAYCCLCCYLS